MTFNKKQLADSELGLVSGGVSDDGYEGAMDVDVNKKYDDAFSDNVIFSALADK